jgi:hypothetical protein
VHGGCFSTANKIPSLVIQISTWVSVGIIGFVVYTQANRITSLLGLCEKGEWEGNIV